MTICKKRKVLKGSIFFINDDLTKSNLNLVRYARKEADHIQSAWYNDGKVLVRSTEDKVFRIQYLDDLQKYNLVWYFIPLIKLHFTFCHMNLAFTFMTICVVCFVSMFIMLRVVLGYHSVQREISNFLFCIMLLNGSKSWRLQSSNRAC